MHGVYQNSFWVSSELVLGFVRTRFGFHQNSFWGLSELVLGFIRTRFGFCQNSFWVSSELVLGFIRTRFGVCQNLFWGLSQLVLGFVRTRFGVYHNSFWGLQVHGGNLHDGRRFAMKIQYPGVARSIESDVDNLMRLINIANLLPKGLYVEQAAEVSKMTQSAGRAN